MDQELRAAIEKFHSLDAWVHFATIGPDGGPHVTPLMMGIGDDALLFSLTGKQKKLNLQRDNRGCISMAKPTTMAHIIVWGTMALRHDESAQKIWNQMITKAFGDQGLDQRKRALAFDGTSLGVFTPTRHRIYGLDD